MSGVYDNREFESVWEQFHRECRGTDKRFIDWWEENKRKDEASQTEQAHRSSGVGRSRSAWETDMEAVQEVLGGIYDDPGAMTYQYSREAYGQQSGSTVSLLPAVPKFEYSGRAALAEFTVNGVKMSVLPDLRVWRVAKGSVEAEVPADLAAVRKLVYGTGAEHKELEAQLVKWDESRLPPAGVLKRWKEDMLKECDGEAEIRVCRKLIAAASESSAARWKWIGVVPKQEATSAIVDVEDGGKCLERCVEMEAEWIGTNWHFHPNKMKECSGVDLIQWSKSPGVHIVQPREGGTANVYVSVMGVGNCWRATSVDVDAPGVVKAGDDECELVGEDGRTKKIGELITRPVPVVYGEYEGRLFGRRRWFGFGAEREEGTNVLVLRDGVWYRRMKDGSMVMDDEPGMTKKQRKRAKKGKEKAGEHSVEELKVMARLLGVAEEMDRERGVLRDVASELRSARQRIKRGETIAAVGQAVIKQVLEGMEDELDAFLGVISDGGAWDNVKGVGP